MFFVALTKVLVGRRCPHYNFTTTDSSKCPLSPVQKVQSHNDPSFLFSKSKTQLHNLLPARISTDIINISNLWLRVLLGMNIISIFSRTKYLRNPMCPGQTPRTYIRDEKWTWTPRQKIDQGYHAHMQHGAKQGHHVRSPTSHQRVPPVETKTH